MCGIAGFFSQNGAIEHALHSLHHRGPDGFSSVQIGDFQLGHCLLAIQNSGVFQPFSDSEQRFFLAFNGEIYNWKELKSSLQTHTFLTDSDTEVLFAGIKIHGFQFLSRVRGIYAFAWLDAQLNQLSLVRDFPGTKPLYYHQTEFGIAFASEIKALPGLKKSPNLDVIALNQLFHFTPTDETVFSGVRRLSPGKILTINLSNQQQTQTEIPHFETRLSFEDALISSVQIQAQSLAKAGAMVSGGIDSSFVAVLAAQAGVHLEWFGYHAKELANFEVDFPYAKRLAEENGVILHEVMEETSDWSQILKHLEEPISDPAVFAQAEIAKRAHESGFRVLLSGLGADELLGGYRRHAALYQSSKVPFGKQLLANRFGKEASAAGFVMKTSRKEMKQIWKLELPSFAEELPFTLESLLLLDQTTYLPNNNLLYADKLGMMHSVEIRVPFLDQAVVSAAKGLPIDSLFSGMKGKQPLRALAKGMLPDWILNRSKTGFGSLESKYVNQFGAEKTQLIDVLSAQLPIDSDALKKLFNSENDREIWSWMVLGKWLELFA